MFGLKCPFQMLLVIFFLYSKILFSLSIQKYFFNLCINRLLLSEWGLRLGGVQLLLFYLNICEMIFTSFDCFNCCCYCACVTKRLELNLIQLSFIYFCLCILCVFYRLALALKFLVLYQIYFIFSIFLSTGTHPHK